MSHYRMILPSTPATTDDSSSPYRPQLVSNQPTVIATEPQALDTIANGGRVILLGDNHGDHLGEAAVAALIPTLERARVTTLAVELPPSMDAFFGQLQKEIRENGLTAQDVSGRLHTELQSRGIAATGGMKSVQSLAFLIRSAAQHNIGIHGIDPRMDSPDYGRRLYTELVLADKHHPDFNSINDVVFGFDRAAADNAVKLLQAQQPDSRLAIVYGAAHACTGNSPERLIDALGEKGVSVTPIRVDQTREIIAGCKDPLSISVSAAPFMKDVIRREGQANPPTPPPSTGLAGAAAVLRYGDAPSSPVNRVRPSSPNFGALPKP